MTRTPEPDRTDEAVVEEPEPDQRQVSEVHNLRGPDTGRGLQIEEGIPPESAARQEEDGPPDESKGNAVRSTSTRTDV